MPDTAIRVPNMDIDWTDWTAHDNCEHIPNAETIAAMIETDEMFRQFESGERVPRYNNFAEILAEIEAEIEAEKIVQS